MQEIGSGNDSEIDSMQRQLGQAMMELEAAREDDAIVVEDVIEDGPAHQSGKFSVGEGSAGPKSLLTDVICAGDRVIQVDGTPVGMSPLLILAVRNLPSPAIAYSPPLLPLHPSPWPCAHDDLKESWKVSTWTYAGISSGDKKGPKSRSPSRKQQATSSKMSFLCGGR
eukprot:758573-Hanusia_phi.AAC.1